MNTRFIKLIALLLLVPSLLSAQNSAAWKEKTSNGYTYKYLPNDPTNTRFYTLPNGLTVILSVNDKQPRVQTYIAVKAGSKTDPSTNTGLAHYLEHMLFKGTDKFGSADWSKEKPLLDEIDRLYDMYNKTTDEKKRSDIYKQIDSVSGVAAHFAIANEYDKIMAQMGASGTNAWTSFEETVYTEDVPSNVINKYLKVQSERFRNPILRIFHTELEAVYEEKNMSLDRDGSKQFEAMFSGLFKKHNYGLQTTLGSVDHLKNPSLQEIRNYFNNYYVPNNMGIVMVGDFNPDEIIKKIDSEFSFMKPREIKPYTFTPEAPITSPVKIDVYGPESENIMMGYRFPGAQHKDAKILELVGSILTNGSAGLLDINLVLEQKLLGAYAFPYVLQDYSVLLLQGNPVQGQSLDDVRDLMLGEIKKLRDGNFSDELLQAIVNNEKKALIETFESYSSTADDLVSYFTSNLDWAERVNYTDILSSITKKDIIEFAKKYLNDDNYVIVYKRQGEEKNKIKVDKPSITPVVINTQSQSDFAKMIDAMPENIIAPKWLDYNKDIQKLNHGGFDFLAVENKDNDLFRLYYRYETGSWNNKYLSLAADYINYIGTNKMTATELSQKMYQLAATFSISVGTESTNINIDGLYENFDETVALVEDLFLHAAADQEALEAYKVRLLKSRENNKKQKGQILRGLQMYAMYGPQNPFNNTLTDEELKNLKAEDLVNIIKDLYASVHKVVYYGPQQLSTVAPRVVKIHKMPTGGLKPLKDNFKYEQKVQTENQVLFAHYEMVQSDIFWVRNADLYNPNNLATVQLFNEYYGGGMGSIVFQTIRESKALAYSTYSYFGIPSNKDYRNTIYAYVGTQSDKFNDAITAMEELMNELPHSPNNFNAAQANFMKSLSTQRITQESIIFSYLNALKMGRDYDVRKSIFETISKLTFNDIKEFHNKEFKNKTFTYCIVANQEKLTEEEMKKLGQFKKLTLEEIFGY